MGLCGTHLKPISQIVLKISIRKISLKNELVNLIPQLSGAIELMDFGTHLLHIFFQPDVLAVYDSIKLIIWNSLSILLGLTAIPCQSWGGWGCEVSCGGHYQQRGKTTNGSALDGAVFEFTQIPAYQVHNMSRSHLYFGFGHFGWLPSFFGQ